MKWVWGFVFVSFFWIGGHAQDRSPVRSVYLTGGAYSGHFTDAFSFTGNPAVLGSVKTGGAGFSSERRWMLKELDAYRLAGSFAAGGGGIGLLFQYTGDPADQETALALAYGKGLGKISCGLQFRYDQIRIAGYGRSGNGSVMLGVRFHPAEKIYAGFCFSLSLPGGKRAANARKTAAADQIGIGYEISALVFLSLQVVRESGLPVNVIGCIDYHWSDQFFAALGIESISSSPYAKGGWKKNRLTIEIFTAFHVELGFTPGIVFFWEGKNKTR
jgi:hypothetical protein